MTEFKRKNLLTEREDNELRELAKLAGAKLREQYLQAQLAQLREVAEAVVEQLQSFYVEYGTPEIKDIADALTKQLEGE
jgi:hypothetical protein